MRLPLVRKIQFGFSAVLAVLLVVGSVAYRDLLASAHSERWVQHTHEVLEHLATLQSAIPNIETGYRGRALTGAETFSQSSRASLALVEHEEMTLRALTVDNPGQQRRLATLAALMEQTIRLDETLVRLRQAGGPKAAAELIQTGQGERILQQSRAVVSDMQVEERGLLLQRGADAERRRRQTQAALIFGSVAGLLIATLAAWRVQREFSRRGGAEHALLESEERFRVALAGVQDYAIYMLDPHGTVISWNAGAERIKGYKAAEIIGQNFSRFYPQEDIDQGKPQEELRIAAASGKSEKECYRVRKDGSRFWANLLITATRDASGNLLGFSEISRDLSERKETEAKYRGLLEAAPDAMVVVDQAGKIVLLNLQAEKQFGYHRDELLGQEIRNIIPEGFAERLIADGTRTAAEALAQQIGTGIELYGRRKDGGDFPIEIMLSPLKNAEGILVTAAIRDISVRKDAEKHLAQMVRELSVKHRVLDSVVEGTTDFIYIRDLEHRFTLVNSALAKLFWLSVSELAGRNLRELIPNDRYEVIAQSDQEIVRTGATRTIEEISEIDGLTRFFLTTKGPYRDADQKIVGTIGISREITERKKSEQQLVKTVGELKRSNEELQQFAYVASHDLQEPLRMVASYTQLLAKRYTGRLDPDADEYIAYAVDGCNRMQGLIQDLLAYSRAGADGRSHHEISSEDALNEALTNLRATIEESGAVVTHDSLPAITMDDTQLVQVFQNLVGNAVKYRSPESPRVHVTATKNGGNECVFAVRDNGVGIDPQYFERIFVLFQRLHGRNEFTGTGIGLAICKKIVERLGGRIWVESQPAKGSTFYFALPQGEAP
jgi:PAS domain S-box-containing protein